MGLLGAILHRKEAGIIYVIILLLLSPHTVQAYQNMMSHLQIKFCTEGGLKSNKLRLSARGTQTLLLKNHRE